MKKIVMYKGDEYRAKTEEKFAEGLFFFRCVQESQLNLL